MTTENIFFRTIGNRAEIRNPDFQNMMKECQPVDRNILGYGFATLIPGLQTAERASDTDSDSCNVEVMNGLRFTSISHMAMRFNDTMLGCRDSFSLILNLCPFSVQFKICIVVGISLILVCCAKN
jgi:hypothetical protein